MDPNELLFGRIAINLGFTTAEEVEQCVKLQNARQGKDPLGQILLRQGFITSKQLEEVLATQSNYLRRIDTHSRERLEDNIFGRLVLKNGFATEEQIQDALHDQAKHQARGKIVPIGTILVEKGILTMDHVRQILDKQWKRILVCDPCRRQFNVFGYKEGKEMRCRVCGSVLRPPDPVRSHSPESSTS